MIIVQLTGGLGNQLFQYAAAKALASYHKTELYLEVSSFYKDELPDLEVPRNFELYNFSGVTEPIIYQKNFDKSMMAKFGKESFFEKLLPSYRRSIYKEPFYHFDKNFLRTKTNVLLKGGWQSEQYFKHIEAALCKVLTLKESIITPVKETAMMLAGKETVAVHIRRGDYLRKQIILEWHGVLEKAYYDSAFNTMAKQLGQFEVFYFSDDPEWVAKELQPIMPGTIVSSDFSNNHFEDFYLMSQCRHNILANSSFSWWAAWLNPNPNKAVVAPVKWFDKAPCDTKDLIPSNWIRV
jgi:Glycosyl transferase family 11